MINREDIQNIVIIADNVVYDPNEISIYDRTPDKADKEYVDYLKEAFSKKFKNVILYTSPQAFIDNAFKHKNDIIFPYWHGENSRNKQSLIASICEAYRMLYIGGDTYTNIVCCDKIISKTICALANVRFPNYKVVSNISAEINLEGLKFPVVIKPIYEGTSIGITQENLVRSPDHELILEIVNNLIRELNQPVIIEEFIIGKEINIGIIGWKNKIRAWGAIEKFHNKDPEYFSNNLHSFDDKMSNAIKQRDARHLINKYDLDNLFKLFGWLDKVEYIRIDGKLVDGCFYCFELSHDTTMNPYGAFFNPFQYQGISYEEVLDLLIDNCLERYNNLYPN